MSALGAASSPLKSVDQLLELVHEIRDASFTLGPAAVESS